MFEVSPATGGDIDAIVRLERETPTAPHWPESDYLAILQPAGGALRRCLLVARLGEELAGFAVGKVVGDEAELESVAVAADVQRRGVGTSLCQAAIVWAASRGASAMDLEVRAASAGAIGLYRRLGFVETGRRTRYYRDPVDDAVLMRRKV